MGIFWAIFESFLCCLGPPLGYTWLSWACLKTPYAFSLAVLDISWAVLVHPQPSWQPLWVQDAHKRPQHDHKKAQDKPRWRKMEPRWPHDSARWVLRTALPPLPSFPTAILGPTSRHISLGGLAPRALRAARRAHFFSPAPELQRGR